MTYGENIQRARNELASALIERPGAAFSAHDFRARDLLLTGLAEMSALIAGPVDRGTGIGLIFERGLIKSPTLSLNRLLGTTAASLPAPDPTQVLTASGSPDSALRVAAKHVTLAAADLADGHGWHFQANQQWVVAKDIADLTRGVALVDSHRVGNEHHQLPNRDRLVIAASAAGQVARGGMLDFVIDQVGAATAPILEAGHPAFLAALQGQQEINTDLAEIPSYRNLRHLVRHQAQVSVRLKEWLTGPLDTALAAQHAERNIAYLQVFKEMRSVNGNLGRGLEAATLSNHVSSMLRFGDKSLTAVDRNAIAALTSASYGVDSRVADAIQSGLTKGIYHVRREVGRSESTGYAPTWASDSGVLRDVGPGRPLDWVRAAQPEDLPIWRYAESLRSNEAAERPSAAPRRGIRDSLDQLLNRAGNGPRPERPHSR